MSTPGAILARPLVLRNGHVLPNRIVKAAMSEILAERDGGPSTELVRLYERWGAGGAGMLLSGNVIVAPEGRTEPANVVVQDERHMAGLRRWAAAAERNGAQLWMQVSHAGRQSSRQVTSRPSAPSAIGVQGFGPLFARPRALAVDEIGELVGRFARAAAIAREAGFSGVQIHGAHGYLVSQFLSPRTNLRDDAYGGTPEKRRRFLLEIVAAVRAAVGADFPISVKLNSADFQRGGFDEQESMEVVVALEHAGIDLLEISGGNYESPEMTGATDRAGRARESSRAREAYFLEYAEAVRARTALPLLLTGGLRSAAAMAQVIEEGAVDAIGLARPLALEPDLPRRLLSGQAQAALAAEPRTGVKQLDSILAVIWYQRQIHRMGAGLDPLPALSRWSSVLLGLWQLSPLNPFARRPLARTDAGRPARLLASAEASA